MGKSSQGQPTVNHPSAQGQETAPGSRLDAGTAPRTPSDGPTLRADKQPIAEGPEGQHNADRPYPQHRPYPNYQK